MLQSAEAAALDADSEARGISVLDLMEGAGRAVASAVRDVAGGAYGRRAAVVCGKGSNGGDGLVAARHLRRWGMGVSVLLLSEPIELGEPAAANLARLEGTGVRVLPSSPEATARELGRADVAVDAVFGTGFRGTAEGRAAEGIDLLNGGPAVVAVDLPSGVEGDTGAVRGPAVQADLTVAMGALKAGTVLPPGVWRAGEVRVADIGFPADLVRSRVGLVEPSDVEAVLPVRQPDAHKRSTGVVLVVAGSRRMTGAPRLTTSGAYRVGAGLVTLAVPEGVLPVIQTGSLEPTFLPLPEGAEGSVSEEAAESLTLDGFDAVAAGPGLSTDGTTPELVRRLVRESPVPVVLDADGLNAFAGRAGELAERRSDLVITPHEGEFGRLFGMDASEVGEDRLGHSRKAAAETRATVLLKGPMTLVAEADGRVRVNPTGSQALATGGTGDVLTGAVAGLLARGLGPFDAASAAAFAHGLAGRLAAERLGDGVTSADVASHLAEVVGALAGQA